VKPELEQLLANAVRAYFDRIRRLVASWDIGPLPNQNRIRGGALGRDLDWLEQVADGRLAASPNEVAAVRKRVLEDLFQPLASTELALPANFESLPLAQVLADAEARASGLVSSEPTPTQVPDVVVPTLDFLELGVPTLPALTPTQVPDVTVPETNASRSTVMSSESSGSGVNASAPSGAGAADWLLGEGTIRGVLSLGGLLVVAAAIIFVVANWGSFPGFLKFGVIFMVTCGLYLLGYTLYNTPIRTAGVTFIAIGSLMAPLNFYALYQFVLKPNGAPPEGAWLLGSVACGMLYATTAWWLRTSLLTYASAAALAALVGSTLSVARAPDYLYPMVGLAVANIVLVLARRGDATGFPQFVTTPLRRSAVVAGALLTMAVLSDVGANGTVPSLALAAGLFGYHGHFTPLIRSRVAAYGLVTVNYLYFLSTLHAPTLVNGSAVMALGILFLVASFTKFFRQYGEKDQWILRGIGYALALLTTGMALARTGDLILALTADVLILAGSAYAYRGWSWWSAWAWGAVWLFIFPWLLTFSELFPASLSSSLVGRARAWNPTWSLGLALLAVNYLVLGGVARRWSFSVAAGFITAALTVLPFSALVVAVFPSGLAVGTALFAASTLVYVGVAIASREAWLLHGTFILLNLTLWCVLNLAIAGPRVDSPATIGTYVALSLAQLYSARWLETRLSPSWAWPVYIWASVNMVLSFGDALIAALRAGAAIGFRIAPHTGLRPQGLMFIAVSALYGAALLHAAWLQRGSTEPVLRLAKRVLAYVALTVLAGAVGWGVFDTRFGGQHFAVAAAWLLMGSFIGLNLRGAELAELYGKPLVNFGLAVVWLPLSLALLFGSPLSTATVFVVGGVLYGVSAFYRRSWGLGYTAGLLLAAAYGWTLQWQHVYELQAYAIPYGLALLSAARLEQSRWQRDESHSLDSQMFLTWSGLALLYGTALAQSLARGSQGAPYLALEIAETVAGLLWGLRIRSRSWVVLSTGFLAAETVFQLFDYVIALPAWVLLGAAGAVLLTAGVLALAKRQELVSVGETARREWEAWSF